MEKVNVYREGKRENMVSAEKKANDVVTVRIVQEWTVVGREVGFVVGTDTPV